MGLMGEQLNLSGIPGHSSPHYLAGGGWATAGAIAIKESLSRGSLSGVMDVLEPMKVKELSAVLREVGFVISPGAVAKGRTAVLEAVQFDLIAATELRSDGFGLRSAREGRATRGVGMAATNEIGALSAIQGVLRAGSIKVTLAGNALPGERGSLVFVAGQAMQKSVQGFGFDGIVGKYEVPLSMGEVTDLHRVAARTVAVDSSRLALGIWAAGGKVNALHEWVPDSVQRLLLGSLSVASASAVVGAIEGGLIGRHAEEIGAHTFSRVLKEQGFDVDALTIDAQAKELDLDLVKPDTARGLYVGPVVGMDHRSVLIKYARGKAVELPFTALAQGQEKPGMGDMVKMKYRDGGLVVGMAERAGREGKGR